jgi:hypothetical protein
MRTVALVGSEHGAALSLTIVLGPPGLDCHARDAVVGMALRHGLGENTQKRRAPAQEL